MAPSTALYAAGVTCLGFLCLALAATAIGIPIWGYYDSPSGGFSYDSDRGYFGPFKTCKQLTYNREKCGSDVSKFRPSSIAFVSGILASLSCVTLAIFCILSVIQIAMISSREKVVLKYSVLVVAKLALAFLSCILAVVATILFTVQINESSRTGFRVTRGISFFLQIGVIVLTMALFLVALYDVIFSKKAGRDPTMPLDTSPSAATTFNNPGFKEGSRSRNGVSVTDASGKPYSGIRNGGSVASMSTTLTSVSNGSTVESVTRSPLRSSLKKPRPRGEIGIQNPGFSGSCNSPPMNRNGSVKKVRIQTHSTEV